MLELLLSLFQSYVDEVEKSYPFGGEPDFRGFVEFLKKQKEKDGQCSNKTTIT